MFLSKVKKIGLTAMFAAAIALPSAGQANSLETLSRLSVTASATVIQGASKFAVGGSEFVVTSVEKVADGMVVVLTNISNGVGTTLKISGDIVKGATWEIGNSIQASVTGSGTILHSSQQQVLAFLPNEAGLALTHTSVYGGGS